MTVEEFVATESAKPFRRWDTDCIGIVEKWVRRKTGLSLYALSELPCSTEDDAQAWLSRPAAILPALSRGMRACGFTLTESPRTGDVGLIHDGTIMHVALRGSALWLTRHSSGAFGVTEPQIIRAWRIE